MPKEPVHDDYSLEDVEALQAQFDALELPLNIDPRLLALWMQREQDEIDRKRQKFIKPPQTFGRSLNRLFAAYIGISVMCLAVILGLLQGQEATTTLKIACIAFLVYTIIGAFVGLLTERGVSDSVESLLRDIVHRSREAGARNIEPENKET